MKKQSFVSKIKCNFFFWLARKLRDYMIWNGFVHEDDYEDYFKDALHQEDLVSEYDLINAIEDITGNIEERIDNLEYKEEDSNENVRDINDRLEEVESFLKNRYGFGDKDECEGEEW